jgi:RNA polymerase sigma factor (sigma-70 family)
VTAATAGDASASVRLDVDGASVVSAEPETPLWTTAARDFAAWREGDPQALERLVRLLTPVLWQIARASGHEREAAEDVVQTTWAALIRGADAVRDPQAVVRWLTTTARREAWRIGRVGRREDAVESEVLEAATPPAAGPEGAVLADRRAHSLWRHVAELPERCQRLLRVIAFDDRPDYTALSSELAMPVGSIGPTRKRCLNKLRELLATDPEWRPS